MHTTENVALHVLVLIDVASFKRQKHPFKVRDTVNFERIVEDQASAGYKVTG